MRSASLSPRASRDAVASAAAGPLAIYVHWPFCRSKCPYCDFNSHVRNSIDEERWCRAYLAQLRRFAGETRRRRVGSVFFGGGTPSLMRPSTVASMLDAIARLWPVASDVEVTLEANPSTAEAGRFSALRTAGIGRLSIGVQALEDEALRFLGRGHTAAEALAAIKLAGAIFPRFSFDLIWGRPGQQPAAWRAELARAATLANDHLSVYQLTIEPGTSFHRRRVATVDEDAAAEMHLLTRDALQARGLPAYEVSNHARPGCECRHNLSIWQGADYVGIGPGAHGRITDGFGDSIATSSLRSPEKWLAAVEGGRDGLTERQRLQPVERREELLLTGLRLTRGIDRERFLSLTGRQPEDAVNRQALAWLADAGFVEHDAAGLRATPEGLLRLNAVLAALIT
jgi:oxygen-independent coproporphyrinogen-3 oxidase